MLIGPLLQARIKKLYRAAMPAWCTGRSIVALIGHARLLHPQMMKTSAARLLLISTLGTALTLGAGCASARDYERGPAPSIPGRMVYDTRYHHDHYYPAPGFVAPGLPRGSLSIGFGGGSYWFNGGVWYRPYGSSFRVILPPLGIVVPLLPSAYVTLRVGGLPYYYANGVYYAAAPGGYAVVNPPADSPLATALPSPLPLPPKPDPIIYPRGGQSAEQTELDRQDCNRWATTQPAAMNDASVFNRAVEACMDGRGYSMR
jgi:hypothetical protein